MGRQPSSRKDLFGTEGIGEDDSDIGTRGHSSQGGTASTQSGGTRGNDAGAQKRTGNPANTQSSGEMPADEKADRLRQKIDRGETGDKVGVSDPAAAPLGTDEEASAGHDEEGLKQARRAPRPDQKRP